MSTNSTDSIIKEISLRGKNLNQKKEYREKDQKDGVQLEKDETKRLDDLLNLLKSSANDPSKISGEIKIMCWQGISDSSLYSPGRVCDGDADSQNYCLLKTDQWTVKISGGVKYRSSHPTNVSGFGYTKYYSVSYRTLESLVINPNSYEIVSLLIAEDCRDAPALKLMLEYVGVNEQYPVDTSLVAIANEVLLRRIKCSSGV